MYDATSDQRRKIAAQRNLQELTEANMNLERHKQLLGGILAILRTASDPTANDDLIATIRSGVDLSQLAAHVRNARRANPTIEVAFSEIEFVIDGPEELPSPIQLLTASTQGSASRGSVSSASGLDILPTNPYLGPDHNTESQK